MQSVSLLIARTDKSLHSAVTEMKRILDGMRSNPKSFTELIALLEQLVVLEATVVDKSIKLDLLSAHRAHQLQSRVQKRLFILDEMVTGDSPPVDMYMEASIGEESDPDAIEVKKLELVAQNFRMECLLVQTLTSFLIRHIQSKVTARIANGQMLAVAKRPKRSKQSKR